MKTTTVTKIPAASPVVIGLDVGTTGCKAVAVELGGRILASAGGTYPLRSPRPGWAQQNIDEIWRAVAASLRKLSRLLANAPQPIVALSLSGAMHSLLLTSRNGEPASEVMTWADQRAAEEVQALRRDTALATALYQRTGCPIQAPYHLPRLRHWMQDYASLLQRDTLIVAAKDWLLHRLTGRWVTDVGLASTTGLLNLGTLTWDDEALRLAGMTADRLPELVESQSPLAGLSAQAARMTGLPTGLPVIPGSSDGGLANLGSGAATDGDIVVTLGTSGAVRVIASRPRLDPRGRTWCYALCRSRYFAGGAINNAGLALRWVRDTFYGDISKDEAAFAKLFSDASAIEPGSQGLTALPYLTGERSPHWRSDLTASLVGLTLGHTRGHIARAVIEATTFCISDVWAALRDSGAIPSARDNGTITSRRGSRGKSAPTRVRLTGGVARVAVWRQVLADVLGVDFNATEAADASAVGAALMGHWGMGHVATLEAAAAWVGGHEKVNHAPQNRDAYALAQHRFATAAQALIPSSTITPCGDTTPSLRATQAVSDSRARE